MSITREKLLDYVFSAQENLGTKSHKVTKNSVLGKKQSLLLDYGVSNMIHEIIMDYYPESDVSTKIKLVVTATFPALVNSTISFAYKDLIIYVGIASFLFADSASLNEYLVTLINTEPLLDASLNDDGDIIVEFPSDYIPEYISVVKTDSGAALTITKTTEETGTEGCDNCLDEDDICVLIDYLERYLNSDAC